MTAVDPQRIATDEPKTTAHGRVAGETLLEVQDLRVRFDLPRRPPVLAVDGVDFAVRRGTVLGVVGESGSGKSMTANAILRLVPMPGRITGGRIRFHGEDLLTKPETAMRAVRGERIAMIFQNPMTALNPAFTIGRQMSDMLVYHRKLDRVEALARSAHLLRRVGIPEVERQLAAYPHQLSGGMRQRVIIGMALSCEPELLIADEPTTALDVTIQAQILEILEEIAADARRAIVLISHDFGVIARLCDDVVVMYRGQVVEHGAVERVLAQPEHPYTRALLGAIPRPDQRGRRLATVDDQLTEAADPCRDGAGPARPAQSPVNHPAEPRPSGAVRTAPLIEARDLVKHFPLASGGWLRRTTGTVRAVDGVSFAIPRQTTVGLVGESGCGKSTVARLLLRLIEPTAGEVQFDGTELTRAKPADLRRRRRELQIVFQDPHSSLNPRRQVGEIIGRPLRIHGVADRRGAERRARELLDLVGLSPAMAERYPHEFSGGQRQRIGIARALALNPSFVVLDEPTSSLDVSVQAQILNLLNDLKRDLGLTYLFVSHNLSVVDYFCDTTLVMYLGQLVEEGPSAEVSAEPLHPYTKALMSAVLAPEVGPRRDRIVLAGDVPSPISPPSGCRFHTRCPYVMDVCRTVEPRLAAQAPGHRVACHLYPGSAPGSP